MPITRSSELLSLAEFGLERFQKLEPFVTALPMGTAINLCTASPELLDSLVEGVQEFTLARENVTDTRKERCYPNRQDFESRLNADQKRQLNDANVIDVKSSMFRSTVWVTIGTTQFTLYSLLYRARTNLVRPVLRSFGTA
jgi:general secretion pathway protein K